LLDTVDEARGVIREATPLVVVMRDLLAVDREIVDEAESRRRLARGAVQDLLELRNGKGQACSDVGTASS